MRPDRSSWKLVLILLAALSVRLPLLPAMGWDRDLHWFRTWAVTAAESGVTRVADRVWCDYPPAYLYVLSAVGSLIRLVAPAAPPDSGPVRVLLKLPATIADLLLAWLIFSWLRGSRGVRAALLGAGVWALSPLVIIDSAWWGQVDSVSTLLLALSVREALRGRHRSSGLLAAAALLTKAQAVVFLLPLGVFLLRRDGYRALLRTVGAGVAGFLLLCLPFFLDRRMGHVTDVYLGAMGRYPFLSLNAHNLWWIVSGGDGMSMSDLAEVIPGFSFRALGLLLFLLFVGTVLLWLGRGAVSEGRLLVASAAVGFGFYMLPTQMHERYVVPVFLFLALLAVRARAGLLLYAGLAFASAATLFVTLLVHWPENAPRLAAAVTGIARPLTLSIAALNLAVLVAALVAFAWSERRHATMLLSSGVLLVYAIAGYSRPSPVWISDLEALAASQGWGSLGRDRSVDGDTLSINGYRFRKGLGAHAPSLIRYPLGGRYRTFTAYIGIQFPNNRGGNEAAFEVLGETRDGQQLVLFSSGPLRGFVDPVPLSLDISGLQTLVLRTSEGADGMNDDHTVWAHARVWP